MDNLTHYIQEAEKQKILFPHLSLQKWKEAGIRELKKNGIPDRKLESWKYTNLNSMLDKNFLISESTEASTIIKNEASKDAHHIYFQNGIYDNSLSDPCPIIMTDIKDLSDEKFLYYKNQLAKDLQNDFSYHLNSAFLNLGHIISLDEHTSLTKPIIFHHHLSGKRQQTSSFNIIHLNTNQNMNLLEIYTSDTSAFFNPTSLIICEQDSRMEHIILQNVNEESLFLGCVQSILKKNSFYNNVCFNFGAKQSRIFLASQLDEEYASTALHGLYKLSQDQHHDTLAKIHHKAPNTFGDQLYKGIIADEAKGIFTGKILVEKEAQQTQAKQLNKNLLLSTKAHAYSRPQLEVYADDVKCAHGSTTGQLSEEELFYFEARGIKKDKARQMLAKAFAYDVVLKIKLPIFKEIIKLELAKKQMDIR